MENPFGQNEISFIDSPNIHASKPAMDTIQAFFDRRLNHGSPQNGITVSKDELGNTCYRSNSTTEATLSSASTPSELVASQAGKQLVLNNPGLLHKIYDGSIHHTAGPFGGLEGLVYRVPLQTGNGVEDYALKYTFPIVTGRPDKKVEAVFHSSGIAAMRMLQLAQRARPSGAQFIAPDLATHDITLAPFIKESIGLKDIMHLENSTEVNELATQNALSSEHKKKIAEIIQEVHGERKGSFKKQLLDALRPTSEEIEDWVESESEKPMFSDFKYNIDGSAIGQSVIGIDDLSRIYQRFVRDRTYRAGNQEFLDDLLQACFIVELGVGNSMIRR